jgi:hypothetical protein
VWCATWSRCAILSIRSRHVVRDGLYGIPAVLLKNDPAPYEAQREEGVPACPYQHVTTDQVTAEGCDRVPSEVSRPWTGRLHNDGRLPVALYLRAARRVDETWRRSMIVRIASVDAAVTTGSATITASPALRRGCRICGPR